MNHPCGAGTPAPHGLHPRDAKGVLMGQRIRRSGAIAAVMVGAVSLLTAAPAAATTSFATGTITYMCSFPTIGQQPLDVKMAFTGPDSVPAGGSVTPAGITGSLVFNATLNAVTFNASNRDGLRGTMTAPVTGTNVTPPSAVVTSLRIPEQLAPYVPGPRTIQFTQDASTVVPGFGAGTPGQAVLSLGTTLRIEADLHQKDGTRSPWTFNCTVKNTNPAQNRAFGPSIPIT
ncbi:DUF6801 domain-containing protein [Amycolatopsis sp. BJA-103]|uniref:DUF6801 domain-containing protein n=1 Tax=Amycolatopsis sp. BJA-103 TaxID=1911175 RepID=UPI001E4A2087|nr:DUF6801 domain-containing protein [Amycolatopsis sp. BJA-103]